MFFRIFLALSICLLFCYNYYKKRNARLPPGPVQLPILGSIIQLHLADAEYVHVALAKLAKKYGDIMSFGYGVHSSVIFSSFETMKTIFQRADTNTHRFVFPYVPDRNYGKNLGILWCNGDTWDEVRTFTKKVLNQFGYSKPRIMDKSFVDSANQLIDSIKNELLDSKDGTVFVESSKFSVHVVNVMWNLLGGYKFDQNDEILRRYMECADKVVSIMSIRNPYNMVPFLKRWFPKHVHHPEHLEIHEESHDFSKILINDAIERRSQRLDSEPTSLIEVFLDKIERHRGDENTVFTDEQLEIVLEDIFLAGVETTGTFLAWSILFLTNNPDMQQKLRRDIIMANNMKSTNDLQSIELKNIPYLKATVAETLRLGNVVPIPLPRMATQDIDVNDYLIPKGTILFYNLHAMYHDEKYWTDPEVFRPERYLQDNGDIDILQSERILNTVLGTGPRICFGESLAIDSLFVFLAALIINFKFEAIPKREPSAENPNAAFCVGPRKFCVEIIPQC